MQRVSEQDLAHILNNTRDYWTEFKNEKVFITGGTGFFGIWLIESFIYANKHLNLNSSLVILTRDPKGFLLKYPNYKTYKNIQFYKGDICSFEYPKEKFNYIIHGATTSAQETYNNEDALRKYDTAANGTRHLLEFAVHCKAKKILYLSSGSVYGKQTSDLSCIKENENTAPNQLDTIASALPEAKRVAEFFCTYYAKQYNIEIKIARCFAFVGPHLQLDIHYAIGNFIKNALEKKEIIINGDGSPERTFMYSADLMIWLWTIFANGKNLEAYNVGSNEVVSIKELALLVSNSFEDKVDIIIKNESEKKTSSSNKYIPCIKKAKDELGLDIYIDLKTSIEKTIQFVRKSKDEI